MKFDCRKKEDIHSVMNSNLTVSHPIASCVRLNLIVARRIHISQNIIRVTSLILTECSTTEDIRWSLSKVLFVNLKKNRLTLLNEKENRKKEKNIKNVKSEWIYDVEKMWRNNKKNVFKEIKGKVSGWWMVKIQVAKVRLEKRKREKSEKYGNHWEKHKGKYKLRTVALFCVMSSIFTEGAYPETMYRKRVILTYARGMSSVLLWSCIMLVE